MEETITILKVGTDEAVTSIGDLRENVKLLKKALNEVQVDSAEGWEEYQKTLKELEVNQTAVRNAMNATSGTFEDVMKSARGASTSYNSLVAQMKELKQAWRATTDVAERDRLGAKIGEINKQLKDLDASTGNFQRNVGNYEIATNGLADKFGKWGDTLKNLPPTLGATQTQANNLGQTMKIMGTQPILGIIGLLAPIIMKITAALKENETAMGAVKKLMESLKPLADLLNYMVEELAKGIDRAISYFIELGWESDGTFQKIISGAIGTYNAIHQFLIAPFKAVIETFKGVGKTIWAALKGDFEEAKRYNLEASYAIEQSFVKGFSFSENFKKGQEIVKNLFEGSANVRKAGEKLGEEAGKGMVEELEKVINSLIPDIDFDKELEDAFKQLDAEQEANWRKAEQIANDRLALIDKNAQRQIKTNELLIESEQEREDRAFQIQSLANERKLELLKQYAQEALEANNVDGYLALKEQQADLEWEIEYNLHERKLKLIKREEEEREKSNKTREKSVKDAIAISLAGADAVAGIMSSLADLYESDEKNSKKNAKKIKGLRIATATIDMLMGAVTAFTSAMQLGPIAGPIVGGINSAAVLTMGAINISKIKSTNVDGGEGSVGAPSAPAIPAVVSPPNIETGLQPVRNVTTASEEERLNRMASSQKVYILQSDIEASNNQSKAVVEETSF